MSPSPLKERGSRSQKGLSPFKSLYLNKQSILGDGFGGLVSSRRKVLPTLLTKAERVALAVKKSYLPHSAVNSSS